MKLKGQDNLCLIAASQALQESCPQPDQGKPYHFSAGLVIAQDNPVELCPVPPAFPRLVHVGHPFLDDGPQCAATVLPLSERGRRFMNAQSASQSCPIHRFRIAFPCRPFYQSGRHVNGLLLPPGWSAHTEGTSCPSTCPGSRSTPSAVSTTPHNSDNRCSRTDGPGRCPGR